ncbi:MAG: Tat pathway signal protein [Peptococcaceae bacterium BICA1-8]|nr:MAG: Tat pathway signal protein [Peptococcaceae bacterium BICA1-8]
MNDQYNTISRRSFLTNGAIAAGTIAVGGGVLGAFNLNTVRAATEVEVQSWPLPYVQLDVEKAKELGYWGYMSNQCAYGAFDAIVSQLKEKVGHPYTNIPSEMMKWGGTGGASWGTLCGSLIGASTAINLVVGKDANTLIDELYKWYIAFPFPEYMPPAGKAGKVEGKIVTSSCGSVLCHASVSEWCSVSKYRAEGKERSERCGRLTADVSAKTVQMLNAYHNKMFTPVLKNAESVGECMTCHGKGGTLENTRGKMDCIQCHDDVDTNNLLGHIKQQWNL